jgi:malonyl-CoA/methylmalonyl-CoA synthetase
VLHFWGFTLHTAEIESALLSLPYIANAIVLPLQDEKYQQRAAAILQIKPSFQAKIPDLDTLRSDLTEKTGLMLFKQPTVVYWLREGEEISLTANGKTSKANARNKFFGDGWRYNPSVEFLNLKGLEYWRMGGQC